MAPPSGLNEDYESAVQFLRSLRDSCQIGQNAISLELSAIPESSEDGETPYPDELEDRGSLGTRVMHKDQAFTCLAKLDEPRDMPADTDPQSLDPTTSKRGDSSSSWGFFDSQEELYRGPRPKPSTAQNAQQT